MRKAPAAILVSALVPVTLAVPVATPPTAAPRPVEPKIISLPLAGVNVTAARVATAGPRADAGRLAVLTDERRTDPFSLLGVTWPAHEQRNAPVAVLVRTRTGGDWSDWASVPVANDHGPDPGTVEARQARAGTEPLYVGPSDGVQVRVETATGATPPGLRLDLVDPGESPADVRPDGGAPLSSASAAPGRPAIYTRAQWGADERIRTPGPGIGATIHVGWVHHTVSANNYRAGQVPGMIRSIYAYHVRGRGYSDIAYNFLVDKFGRLWEGRHGGIAQPVIGAHTENYNYNTFAIAAIGNLDVARPTPALLGSITRLQAWKLSLHYRDPDGVTALRGRRFAVISGHRDSKSTACPGRHLYRQIGAIRAQTLAALGAGFVAPAVGQSRTAATLTAGAARSGQRWTAALRLAHTGWVPRRVSGGTPRVAARLPYTDRFGLPLPTGYYTVRLDGSYRGRAARPFGRTLAVAGSPPTAGTIGADGSLAIAAISRQQRLLVQTAPPAAPLGPAVDVGATPNGTPAVATMGNGRLAVAHRGRDATLYVKRQTADGAWPARWERLPGRAGGSPAVLPTGPAAALDVFARGPSGQLLRWHSPRPGAWTAARSLGGDLAHGMAVGAVRTGDGAVTVVARAADGGVWLRRLRQGAWDPLWTSLGGSTRGDVSAAAAGRQTVLVSLWAADDRAVTMAIRGGRPGRWARVSAARSGVPPALASGAGRVELLIRDAGGRLLSSRWSSTGWQPWQAR